MKIFMFILTLLLIFIIMSTLTILISKKSTMDREKSSPFECGFSPISKARMPFSIHFFLIAMVFLIFDIELSLILPMNSFKTIKNDEWLKTSFIVMTLISYGLYHEWLNGILQWSK
uniref:NADH dehydrogenase subunit 3 n=1 Tax=Oecleopsis sinicus TaxID=1308491 RepID=UPI0021B4D994|nr:NADH dehydrogenase subunit 3 [Oecleopsis sinicus]UVV36480.1 NADH dehydrogenase subunit 3 [Oecleopsis sinicus]